MNDYDDGKIYILYILGFEEYGYVGSTIYDLKKRYIHHRDIKSCSSKILFDDGNDVVIKLLENYPCNNRKELLARERYWKEQYPECVNIRDPIISDEERYERQYNRITQRINCSICNIELSYCSLYKHMKKKHY